MAVLSRFNWTILDLEFSYLDMARTQFFRIWPIRFFIWCPFLDAADTKPIEQQFWKERLEQSVKHKYFATQIRHGDSAY